MPRVALTRRARCHAEGRAGAALMGSRYRTGYYSPLSFDPCAPGRIRSNCARSSGRCSTGRKARDVPAPEIADKTDAEMLELLQVGRVRRADVSLTAVKRRFLGSFGSQADAKTVDY